MNKKSNISKIGVLIIGLILLNFISDKLYQRFDLTEDQRYTLSEPAKNILEKINAPIIIKVYLEGDFPTEFKRLQIETQQLLEELKSENNKIQFRFINPLGLEEDLLNQGLVPSQLSVQENGVVSEIVIFPWATIKKGNKTERISLLKDTNAQTQEAQLENAIQNLEYAFVDAIHKINAAKSKSIAVLNGNNELDDIYIYDFLQTLGQYYHLAKFTLDSVASNPKSTLKNLTEFDLVIIAKPTERFTENEKYTLDQYFINGGKTLWLVDNVHAELDSLITTGASLAFPRDLNLTDLFFNYGARINADLVTDLYASKIPLATGNVGNQTQYDQFLWTYYPLTQSANNHPINKHIEAVNFKFTSSIDLLKNDIEKTILLQSSPLSKTVGTPTIVELKSISENKNPTNYNNGNQPLAVLLEGEFKSAYADRIKPFKSEINKDKSEANKMILIADGDVIANDISRGQPTPLGIDKWTGQRFGNKEFLMNSVNYLLDDAGLLEIRNKTVDLKILNREKAFNKRTFYQFLNVVFPLAILGLFGIVFNLIRKRKYS
ncbi:MAG: gliding motility-associated ABC transporter substrate-binding protein GldG [Flavobacteriaceae bacterium]|nr:MAG: gliding motility-associated ABC transporter substrate-binding protein GldG [Flavobacteriaceae bacterium]